MARRLLPLLGLLTVLFAFQPAYADGIVLENRNGQESYVVFPQMPTEGLDQDNWVLLLDGVSARQSENPLPIHVLMVGENPDEAFADSAELIEKLEKAEVEYRLVFVPRSMAEELKGDADQILAELDKAGRPGQQRLRWNHLRRKADFRDWMIGILMGGVTGALNGYMWFYQSPIDPHIAWALIASMSVPTFYHTLHLKTFDRVYRFKLFGKTVGKKVTAVTEIAKRQMVNLFYAELYRLIGMNMGDAASPLTLQGQIEIFSFLLASGIGSSIFSSQRNRHFHNDPITSQWVNFYHFLIMFPLVLRDIGGQYMYTFEFGAQFHDSTLMVLAGHLILSYALRFQSVRDLLTRMAMAQDNWTTRIKDYVVRTADRAKNACSRLVGSTARDSQ